MNGSAYRLHGLAALFAVAVSLAFLAQGAAADPANVHVDSADLISPTQASAFYGSASTHTDSLCAQASSLCARPRAAALRALSRTLSGGSGNPQSDPIYLQRVFEYVHNNIRTEFRYGLSKGGFGALLDQSGTAFDQAQLMVELLRQGGVSASYQFGTITLTAAQFSAWTGISDARVACRLLADGAIPAIINGTSSATCDYTGAVSSVTLAHVWVSSGSNLYDPAYKVLLPIAGLDLNAATGCTSPATCAASVRSAAIPSGASHQGFDTTAQANYVQNVDETTLATTLNTLATNVQHYIEANAPTAQIEGVIGGNSIQPSIPTAGPTLPYPSVAERSLSEIPDQFRTRLRVQFDSTDVWLFSDETYGNWLEIGGAYDSATTRHSGVFYETDLAAGSGWATPVAAGAASGVDQSISISLTIDHPYAAASGAYADQTTTHSYGFMYCGIFFVPSGSGAYGNGCSNAVNPAFIINYLGQTGAGHQQRDEHIGTNKYIPPAIRSLTPDFFTRQVTIGAPYYNIPTNTASMGAATSWQSQAARATAIIDALNATQSVQHHTLGLEVEIAASKSFVIDAQSSYSVVSLTSDVTRRAQTASTDAQVLSALEGSAAEQSEDLSDGGSTASLFGLANEHQQRFYDVNAYNVDAILAASTNYGQSESLLVRSYTSAGYSAIVSQNARIGSFGNSSSSAVFDFGPLLAYNPSTLAFAHTSTVGGKGAAAAGLENPVDRMMLAQQTTSASVAIQADIASGGLHLSMERALVAGDTNHDLPLSVYYSTADAQRDLYAGWTSEQWNAENLLRRGWATNYEITARFSNDGQMALGRDLGLDASASIAALYAINALNSAPTFQDRVASLFSARWWSRQLTGNAVLIRLPPSQETFQRLPDGRFNPRGGSQSRLTQTGSRFRHTDGYGLYWTYGGIGFQLTAAHGETTVFQSGMGADFNSAMATGLVRGNFFHAALVSSPRGQLTFTYSTQNPAQGDQYIGRLARVTNDAGRSLDFAQVSETPQGDGFGRYMSVTTDDGRTLQFSERASIVGSQASRIIQSDGTYWQFAYPDWTLGSGATPNALQAEFAPGNTSTARATFTYDALNRIASSSDGTGRTTNYFAARTANELSARGFEADAAGNLQQLLFDFRGLETEHIDRDFRTSSRAYDGLGRLIQTIDPSGAVTQYAYDVRSNLLSITRAARAGSAEAGTSLIHSYIFGEGPTVRDCANPLTCNSPTIERDERGYARRYTWNSSSGLLSRIESGLQGPDSNLVCGLPGGVCPQTDATYVAGGSAQRLVPGQLTERISASQSRVTTYSYDSANKYVLRSQTIDPGGLSLTTTFSYDPAGNVTEIDGPRTDAADVADVVWDSLRRMRARVDADPDGAGPLPRSAVRYGFNTDGTLSTEERGTTTLANASNFTAVETTSYSYDGEGRAVRVTTPAGIQQMSYDAVGRLLCRATRMNPAVFNSLPQDACSQSSTGGAEPDRITRLTYSPEGHLLVEQRGYASTSAQAYATYTYTATGQRESISDANNHRTDYAYDGFDRLCRVFFPDVIYGSAQKPLTCLNPVGGDNEIYAYDPAGNMTTRTLRGGDQIAYSYDALNRQVVKDLPGGSSIDVFTGYDLLGERLYSRFASANGAGVDSTYDVAGRLTTETMNGRSVSYQYDAAGNRTRVTWPDGFYAQYAFDAQNRLDTIRENGSALLDDYDYDLVGRLSRVTRGDNSNTSYSYDAASRLAILNIDLPQTSNDQQVTFSYSPASQVTQRVASNDNFAWLAATGSWTYQSNSINQYSSVNGNSFSYDARGNLTSDGSRTFAFDFENRLTSVSGAASLTLSYDPLGRLARTANSSTNNNFLYSGSALIAEYDDSGTLLRRYVHGANIDEPAVWYEGSGSTDRRYLFGDAQGSIVASSGASVALYSYGAFGEPNVWTGSRFRFTGQTTLPELGLYYYKARVYDPVLGRFLQTDPVGYSAGDMNLYAYVRNDPIDRSDPTGEICKTSGNTVNCDSPMAGVPNVSFPRPQGWPREISPQASGLAYHHYRYDIPLTSSGSAVARSAAEGAAIRNPTPGSQDSPATQAGTTNDVGRIAFQDVNPVKSYVEPMPGGAPGQNQIVNVTLPGHELNPGYIVQYFTTDPQSGAVTYHVAGEGAALTQSDWNPFARVMERNVWGQQAEQIKRAIGY